MMARTNSCSPLNPENDFKTAPSERPEQKPE
jgi:hypothetical protein